MGQNLGSTKGDTRSLDYSSLEAPCSLPCDSLLFPNPVRRLVCPALLTHNKHSVYIDPYYVPKTFSNEMMKKVPTPKLRTLRMHKP